MRNLPEDIEEEYTGRYITPVVLIEMMFSSGPLRLWTGVGDLMFEGNQYTGAGNFIGTSPIEETQDIQAKGIVATLNGMNQALVALALAENCRGRPFRMYLSYITKNQAIEVESGDDLVETEDGGLVLLELQAIGTPYKIFSGLMDYIEGTDTGRDSTLRLNVENVLIIGQRSKIARYTSEDQRRRFPDDKGLDMINQLQDKEVVW